MLKRDIKILIVDDDPTFGPSMESALNRDGYSCHWVSSPEEAQTSFKITEYHVVIIDCMLPKVNGVQLAEAFRQRAGENFKIFLVSGIFKDRTFINDSVHKTRASGFFTKPFEMRELLDAIDSLFIDEIDTECEPLFQLLTSASPSPQERLKAIEDTQTVHGFDLPLVYSLLVGTNISGHLNIISNNGEISSVAFSEGNISHVNVNDKTSYFGILLVEHGFTTGEEVKLSLNRPSEKPIGERLVEANALSPHAIRIIRQEQLAIRLSKTIQNSSVQVSFLEHPVHQSKDGIDRDLLTNQLNDWVLSKVTVDWLRAYFTPWLDHALLIGSKKRTEDRAIRDSQLGLTPEILKLIDDVRTVQDILNESSLDEEKSLRIIYFLLLEKIVVFAAGPVNSLDFQGKYQRLKIMAGEIEKQNHFEILGISQNAQDREINRAYLELAKALHPDKLSPRAPENVRTLQHSIFSKIAEAYDILRDRGRREIYINELTMGHADEMLHIESVFEEAHGLLFRGRYQKALAILEKIAEGKKHRTDLIVYLLWAKIKVGSLSKDSAAFIDEITYQLNLVPPEERHTPIYIYVKGLYLKMIGNVDKAYVYFKHAVTMDPSLSPAKREMIALEGDTRRVTTNDLTSVVSMFFHNKGKSARKQG